MACFPVTRPVLKIALVAPFEGRYAAIGREVIYAVRLAVREANANGGIAGYSVELLALNDNGDADLAIVQAQKVAADPQVVGAVGNWLEDTTNASMSFYGDVPLLATTSGELTSNAYRLWPQLPITNNQLLFPAPFPADTADPDFVTRYQAPPALYPPEPGAYAVLAYDAAHVLFAAIERDIQANGKPSRAGVLAALAKSDVAGLSGRISFDEERNWEEAKIWEYNHPR